MKGLRARGGFEVDIAWQDGKLTKTVIHSMNGNRAVLRYGTATKTVQIKKGESFQWTGN